MIEHVEITNYKSLRSVAIELTPLHVLIGPNNSGKTSILEAIRALCHSVDVPLNLAFSGRWKGLELVWAGIPNSEVSIAAKVIDGQDRFSYTLGCQFSPGSDARQPFVRTELFVAPAIDAKFNEGSTSTSVYNIHRAGGMGGTELQIRAAQSVHKALSGVHYYRWQARHLALPVAPDSNRRFQMEESGFGLALCMDDILGFDRELFGKMENRFKQIFPEIESIKLLPEKAFRSPVDLTQSVPMFQISDGKGIFFQFKGNPALVPASQVSDGILLVLAYLTVLSLPDPPRVLLVEEPENGIHPNRLSEVMGVLRDMIGKQSRTQIIMTTHSPYVLDHFKPEEVTLCRRERGETKVSRLSNSKEVRDQIDIFSLGEIWTAEGDDKIAVEVAPEGGEK